MKKKLLSPLLILAIAAACAKEPPVPQAAAPAQPAGAQQAAASETTADEHHHHDATGSENAATASAADPAPVKPADTPEPAAKPKLVQTTKATQLATIDLASTVLDPASFKDPYIRDTYAQAKQIADRIDQMYCYCRCRENEGLKHKSLLTCYQDDHAAGCGICLQEVNQAHLDWKDGLPLEVTLKAVDMMYNNGKPAPGHSH